MIAAVSTVSFFDPLSSHSQTLGKIPAAEPADAKVPQQHQGDQDEDDGVRQLGIAILVVPDCQAWQGLSGWRHQENDQR